MNFTFSLTSFPILTSYFEFLLILQSETMLCSPSKTRYILRNIIKDEKNTFVKIKLFTLLNYCKWSIVWKDSSWVYVLASLELLLNRI